MKGDATFRMRDRIEEAWARRAGSDDLRSVDALRVVNGRGDAGPPGLTIDRYSRYLVVSAREELQDEVPRAWGEAAAEALGADGVVLKTLARSVGRSRSEVILGAVPSEPIPIREDDAVYLCDLDRGVSTGLFLDHRDTRRRIRAFSEGGEVLNLFAYTCAFSIHAAKAGARRVTNVDSAKKALARGRENMVASGLDPDRHRWFADDVIAHLARQRRRGPMYDLVIADAPVLGRARAKVFSLERDLQPLARDAIASTKPGGIVVIAAHATALSSEAMVEAATRGARELGRRVDLVEELGLPAWDHPTVPSPTGRADDSDRGDYLKTLVLRAG
jgi:23S rRNA (cytosine1962-C5)-methyltransferase